MWHRWIVPRHHGDACAYTAKCRADPLVCSKAFFCLSAGYCHGLGRLIISCSALTGCRCRVRSGHTGARALFYQKICYHLVTVFPGLEPNRGFECWNSEPRYLGPLKSQNWSSLKTFSCLLLHGSSNWVLWNFRRCVFWNNISWVETMNEVTEVLLIPTANRGYRRSGQGKDDICL